MMAIGRPPEPEAGVALTEVTMRIRHAGCLAETLPEGARLAQLSGDAGGGVFVLHAPDETQLERVLLLIEQRAGRRATRLAGGGASCVFRLWGSLACPLARRIQEAHVLLWPVLYTSAGEVHRVLCASSLAARQLVADLSAHAKVEVLATANAPADALDLNLSVGSIAGALTRRQLDALELAIHHGYYQVPRQTDTLTLAEAFGVGRSTYEEHLRKAERVVLMQFGALLSEHARLASGATKGRGRPPRL